MEFNLLTPQSSKTTQAQIDAYRQLQQQPELSGFGQSNVSVDVSTSPTQPDNFWGYWIKPDGSVVDTRKVGGTSFINKVMKVATPIIMTIGATAASGGLASVAAGGTGALGLAGGAMAGATMSGASGEKIALAGILSYLGGEALGYLKNAYSALAGVPASTLDGLSSAEVIAKCQEAGMTSEQIAGFLQEAAESGGIDLSEATISKALTSTIPEVVKEVGSDVVTKAVSETAQNAPLPDPSDVLQQGAKVAGGAGVLGAAGSGISNVAEDAPSTGGYGPDYTSGMSTADMIKLGITALPVAGAVVNSLTGGNDAQTLSALTTTDTRPAYVKGSAEKLWNDYIDDFYGVGGQSVKDRETETADYKAAADATYLADTKTAMEPYQKQLTDLLGQADTGTGYFTPLNLTTSKGGVSSPLVSFVPKQNKETATQVLGMGKTSADTNALLAELQNQLALKNLPNAAADSYSAKLAELMKYANTGGSTTTETGQTAGTSSWADILNAVNTAANIYGKFSGYQSSNDDLINKLTAALSK